MNANFLVGLASYQAGAVDEFGNPAGGWAAPVDTAVFGWAPAGTSEPFETGRAAVTWDLDLFAPFEFTSDPRDRVVVDGVTYEVEGVFEDFTTGPFGFAPGGRLRLRKVEG